MSISSRVATIDLADIRPARANRPLSKTHVRDLVASFGATTFATTVILRPIDGDPDYGFEPIACFHRIEAARQSGQKVVHAIIVEDANDLQLELIQLHENLLHKSLAPLQEAKAMARARDIYQKLNPASRRGGNRRSKAQSGPLAHADAIAQATGRSKTTVNRLAARGKRIVDDVEKLVEGTALDTGTFLDRLAKLPPEEQRKLVSVELANAGHPKSKGEPDVEGDLGRLRRAWEQTCEEARKKFLAEVSNSVARKAGAEL